MLKTLQDTLNKSCLVGLTYFDVDGIHFTRHFEVGGVNFAWHFEFDSINLAGYFEVDDINGDDNKWMRAAWTQRRALPSASCSCTSSATPPSQSAPDSPLICSG